MLLLSSGFYQIQLFSKNLFRNTVSVKRFGSRSGQTFYRSRSRSKLFVKFISRHQKSPLARKELMTL